MILIYSVCDCQPIPVITGHRDTEVSLSTCVMCGKSEKYHMIIDTRDFSRVHRALVDAGALKPSLFPPYRRESDETKTEEHDDEGRKESP